MTDPDGHISTSAGASHSLFASDIVVTADARETQCASGSYCHPGTQLLLANIISGAPTIVFHYPLPHTYLSCRCLTLSSYLPTHPRSTFSLPSLPPVSPTSVPPCAAPVQLACPRGGSSAGEGTGTEGSSSAAKFQRHPPPPPHQRIRTTSSPPLRELVCPRGGSRTEGSIVGKGRADEIHHCRHLPSAGGSRI